MSPRPLSEHISEAAWERFRSGGSYVRRNFITEVTPAMSEKQLASYSGVVARQILKEARSDHHYMMTDRQFSLSGGLDHFCELDRQQRQ